VVYFGAVGAVGSHNRLVSTTIGGSMEVKLPDLTMTDLMKVIAEKELLIVQLKKLIEEMAAKKEAANES
jgi:hypothetical protein